MSLPTSRNTTYAPDSPVKSTDLNDIQDCIAGAGHGTVNICVPGISGVRDANWATASNRIVSTAAGTVLFPFQLREGDRIKNALVYRYGDGVADITDIDVYVIAADGTATNITTSPISVTNPAAAVTATVVALDDTTLDFGESVYLRVVVNAANIRIYNVVLEVDRPL